MYGESWIYPGFKGYHAEFYRAVIETAGSSFKICNENEGMILQLGHPLKPAGAYNGNTSPPFPESNIGIMSAIVAIGTKFQSADKLGPQIMMKCNAGAR